MEKGRNAASFFFQTKYHFRETRRQSCFHNEQRGWYRKNQQFYHQILYHIQKNEKHRNKKSRTDDQAKNKPNHLWDKIKKSENLLALGSWLIDSNIYFWPIMVRDSKYSISKQIKRNTTTKKTNYNIVLFKSKNMPKIIFSSFKYFYRNIYYWFSVIKIYFSFFIIISTLIN